MKGNQIAISNKESQAKLFYCEKFWNSFENCVTMENQCCSNIFGPVVARGSVALGLTVVVIPASAYSDLFYLIHKIDRGCPA